MTLLNDIQGTTAQIMVYSSHQGAEGDLAPIAKLGNLPAMLPDGCSIVWVVRSAKPLKFPAHASGRPLLPVHIDSRIDAPRGRWLQDPFLCLNDGKQIELVVTRDADAFALDAGRRIAAATERSFRSVRLQFAGGNMLRLDDTLLVGRDLALDNGLNVEGDFIAPDKAAWAALEQQIRTECRVEHIVWVGLKGKFEPGIKPVGQLSESWQPLFHLDLFLLPGGRSADGRLRLFLGEVHPVPDIYMDAAQEAALDSLRTALEEVREHLHDSLQGLELLRMPIIIYPAANQLMVHSLCNGWLDRGPKGDWAYLPDYRKAKIPEQYAAAAASAHAVAESRLCAWGIAARWVHMDFHQYAQDGGALHCAVKVLQRNHESSPYDHLSQPDADSIRLPRRGV